MECYNGDGGVVVTVRQAHRDWAAMRSRQDLMTNLLWKTSAAMTCLDQAGQARLFADMSVVIAKAAQGVQAPAPGKVVWQLADVVIKDITPSGTKFLRIDDAQADSKGGSIRITALNDGECAPGQGVPDKPLEERFWFRWRFDRDVTRIAYPEKFDVVFSIDGDGIVPCFDLNPFMTAGGDGRALEVRQGSARFQFATPHYFHVGNPRTVEVYNPESGLERGTTAMTPTFSVMINGFRGNRGMLLQALYSYTLVK